MKLVIAFLILTLLVVFACTQTLIHSGLMFKVPFKYLNVVLKASEIIKSMAKKCTNYLTRTTINNCTKYETRTMIKICKNKKPVQRLHVRHVKKPVQRLHVRHVKKNLYNDKDMYKIRKGYND